MNQPRCKYCGAVLLTSDERTQLHAKILRALDLWMNTPTRYDLAASEGEEARSSVAVAGLWAEYLVAADQSLCTTCSSRVERPSL